MTSPSISSTSRSTPWAAGCWGPKCRVRFLISGIARLRGSGTGGGLIVPALADDPWHQHSRLDGDGLVDHPLFHGIVSHLHMARGGKVLAHGVADEAVVGEDPPQVRMALEENAEQVEGLPL